MPLTFDSCIKKQKVYRIKMPYIIFLVVLAFSFINVVADEYKPRVEIQRTFSCPEVLDARSLSSEEGLKQLVIDKLFTDLQAEPLTSHFRLEQTLQSNKYYQAKGGIISLNEDLNTVSRLTCHYEDYNEPGSRYDLTVHFKSPLSFHVKGYLPEVPEQSMFATSEQSCSNVSGDGTDSTLPCELTPAFILFSNHIDIPAGNRGQYGSIKVMELLSASEYMVPPGKTAILPLVQGDNFALELGVIKYHEIFDVSGKCLHPHLPYESLFARYGSSPHITFTGIVTSDGNLDNRSPIKCSMSCSELKPDCWEESWKELAYWKSTRLEDMPSPPNMREYAQKLDFIKKMGRPFTKQDQQISLDAIEFEFYALLIGADIDETGTSSRKNYKRLSRALYPDKISSDHHKAKRFSEKIFHMLGKANSDWKDMNPMRKRALIKAGKERDQKYGPPTYTADNFIDTCNKTIKDLARQQETVRDEL